MVIVELIGSISLAIALISAILLFIIHIKYKQNDIIYHQQLDNDVYIKERKIFSTTILPFEQLNEKKRLTVIEVEKSSNEEIQLKIIDSSIKNNELDQGDSLSFNDENMIVRKIIENMNEQEKNNENDSDLTNIDNQTLKTDLNQNQQKFSHHSSISNLDVTIPSNLSSSIDLEQFECISTTSNLSEFLKD